MSPPVSLQAHNRFDSLMENNKINITKVESFADDPSTAIQNLKVKDVCVCVCVCVCVVFELDPIKM